MLQQVYQASVCLLAPSEGEGFGLPLIEAARCGLPVIARDIPVFREVAGGGAFYFSGMEGASLAEAVRAWLELHADGVHPAPSGMKWNTWQQNAEALMAILRAPARPLTLT
jgi:glycosyltransferase involved in cell wall biosynthesis